MALWPSGTVGSPAYMNWMVTSFWPMVGAGAPPDPPGEAQAARASAAGGGARRARRVGRGWGRLRIGVMGPWYAWHHGGSTHTIRRTLHEKGGRSVAKRV